MRLRHKKHLNERLSCVDNLIMVEKGELNSLVSMNNPHYINLKEVFPVDNPLTLEIGCGYGSFARQYAEQHKNKNIIAVEKISDVIVKACEQTSGYINLKYLNICAKYLLTYFKKHSISEIYLNFSTPYQKESYAKNRLTHKAFLDIYSELLTSNGFLSFKTDNDRLFEFTIEQLQLSDWKITEISKDLHASIYNEENIVTEYEKKFSDDGIPIKYLKAIKNNTEKVGMTKDEK